MFGSLAKSVLAQSVMQIHSASRVKAAICAFQDIHIAMGNLYLDYFLEMRFLANLVSGG